MTHVLYLLALPLAGGRTSSLRLQCRGASIDPSIVDARLLRDMSSSSDTFRASGSGSGPKIKRSAGLTRLRRITRVQDELCSASASISSLHPSIVPSDGFISPPLVHDLPLHFLRPVLNCSNGARISPSSSAFRTFHSLQILQAHPAVPAKSSPKCGASAPVRLPDVQHLHVNGRSPSPASGCPPAGRLLLLPSGPPRDRSPESLFGHHSPSTGHLLSSFQVLVLRS